MSTSYSCRIKRGIGLILLLTLLLPNVEVKAASVGITFDLGGEAIKTEDSFSVSILLSSEEPIGNFEGYITYNSDILTYVDGPSCVTGGSGILKISDQVLSSSSNQRKYVLQFEASGRGYCEFGLGNDAEVYDADNISRLPVSSTVLGFEVGASEGASADAGLSSLKISPGTLEPEFSPNVKEYNTTIDVDKLIVSAIPESPEASVTVTGNADLSFGQNRVVILVTAEDGSEQKYIIYAVREEVKITEAVSPQATVRPDLTPTQEPKKVSEEGVSHSFPQAFEAYEEDGNVLIQGGFRYQVLEENDKLQLPSGYEKTSLKINGISVTAYAPEQHQESEFFLMLLQREGSEAGIYRYDRTEKTIQRFSGNGSSQNNNSQETSTSDVTVKAAADYEQNISTLSIIVAVLCGVCAILTIGLIRYYMKAKGLQGDDLD